MKFKQFGVLLSVATVFAINSTVTKALAQPEPSIQFGQAIGEGGCTIADQLTGSDGRTISILLDNMHAENGARQRCLLRIETVIPSGFHVQDVQFLYQGSTEVASGSKGANLSRSYIFNGGALGQPRTRPATKKFASSEALFQVEDPLTVVSASCGGQGTLGINMVAQSSPGSSIVVDSADGNIGDVKVHVDLVPCP